MERVEEIMSELEKGIPLLEAAGLYAAAEVLANKLAEYKSLIEKIERLGVNLAIRTQ